jgi:excinuclease ABC subunit C
LLRDDKSYPYIFLSSKDAFPRLALHRGTKKLKGDYYGPFPSASAIRESLAVLQKVFQVRQCEDSFFRNRTRPCLQYQIKRCSGPCVNLVTPEDYAQDVRNSVLFIAGHNDQITLDLGKRMEQVAADLRFEEAAKIRDQIRDLRLIQEHQYVVGEKGDVDVLAISAAAGIVCVHLVFIRNGRNLGSRNYYPKFVLESAIADCLHSFIAFFYLGDQDNLSKPKEIICSVEPAEKKQLETALAFQNQHKILIRHKVRGHRQKWLELAQTNALHGLQDKLNSSQNMHTRLVALQLALSLQQLPTRLECFDISHTSGEATVASCVVFDQNGPLKADYRRFNIEGITAADDYAAMSQALKRRYTRLQKGEGKIPDLLIIDGGKGQLTQAETVLSELQIQGVLIIGVAKGISRKAGQETLILGNSHRELTLPAESPALHVLQHIRDEAHRFAITAHRQRRGKARNQSLLDTIPGVGPKKRKELLQFFGGQHEIRRAQVVDLQRVPGISKQLATTIYDFLQNT